MWVPVRWGFRIAAVIILLGAVAYEWPLGIAALVTWALLRWAPGGRWLVGVLVAVAVVWGLVGGLAGHGGDGLRAGGIHAVALGPPVGILVGFLLDRWKR